ncbi:MAG: Serine phosphatase RsbU, regulator of sigma subunit [uncultured Solirubrobacteraceae bacterium]|uniref:Serine phosphatase RsbU, regulator of sigma subunit n=1 Tax=uncultured Solirubrobacteraceae bacterium TaxID=1162706 RepID=A0A6J4RBN7_9ACTN|nr:MAG: Serine phosphatase RsbU, regulator of sigma subunit [uncultured Solirubrobacteraceae bacterium]
MPLHFAPGPLTSSPGRASELPDELWEARHAWMLRILHLHVPALLVVAVAFGAPLGHGLQELALLLGLALAATHVSSRRARSLLTATALLTSSAMLVHFSGGLIEAHFHFFVVVTLLAFYEDRAVYALAVVYVLGHHGVLGALAGEERVFSHPDHPGVSNWTWASVHAGFIMLAGLANMLLSSLNERYRDLAAREAEQRARAEAHTAILADSLSPSALPALAGRARAAAAHRAGDGSVGGDFYEVVELPDGRIGVGLGDVAGRGPRAAVLTARLRHTLRAYASDGLEPASVMDKLERALGDEGSATCAYLLVDPEAGTVTGSLAGHLPPVVVLPDRRVEMLSGGLSVPLAGLGVPHVQETRPLPAGATLLVYTDGLVERRDESIDVSLRRLREAVVAIGPDPAALCEQLPAALLEAGPRNDDVAVVALRTEALPRPSIPRAEHLTTPLG